MITVNELEKKVQKLEKSLNSFKILMNSNLNAISDANENYSKQELKNQIYFAKQSVKDFTVDTKLEYEVTHTEYM